MIKNRKKTIKKLIAKIKKRIRSLNHGIVLLYFDGYLVDSKYYEESIEDYFLKSKKIPSYVYIGTSYECSMENTDNNLKTDEYNEFTVGLHNLGNSNLSIKTSVLYECVFTMFSTHKIL